MLNNPALLQITKDDGIEQTVDIFPIYRQEGELYVATQAYRIYEGYPAEEGEDFEERLVKYLEYVELEGEANPGFLGELHFEGVTAFEWRYREPLERGRSFADGGYPSGYPASFPFRQ
jgi:hypothetical protein